MVRISPFLRTLYSEHLKNSDVVDFLRDFRAMLHVDPGCQNSDIYKPICEIHLVSNLADAGFSVATVKHYGRILKVELVWSFQDSHPTWEKIHAGRMTFYVSEGKITKAAWKPNHWEESIEDLFWQRLRSVAPSDPIKCFASEQDLQNLLLHIEWEPTLLLSTDQLDEQRRNCVAEFPQLWEQPMAIARLLAQKKLYASSTSPHQIAKNVVKVIAALRSKKSEI